MISFITKLDFKIMIFIQKYIRRRWLNHIMRFITSLGDYGTIWIIISFCLLLHKKTRKIGIIALTSGSICLFVNNTMIKNLVHRIRPYEKYKEIKRIIQKPNGYSFPSGHTCGSFAVAGIFYHYLPKEYGILSLILAFFIGVSRTYVGVHYPTDVIFGAFIGLTGSRLIYKIVENKNKVLIK